LKSETDAGEGSLVKNLAACSDGKDNDGNGKIDCEDSDCAGTSACKTDTITCTVVNGDFQLEHSNGSHDFTGKTVAIGQTDPKILKYEIEYTSTENIFRSDIYLDNKQIHCPPITIPHDEDSSGEPLETCDDIIQGLQDE
jgi:major membrane immunogen (membrane-anchored lipoprotein)